jgi:polysaccharide biosynthesis/export protein
MRSTLINLCYIIGVVVVLSSCVGNKRVVFVQKRDVHKANPPIDSVMRTYTAKPYDYRIQPMDILSIRFESLTPAEFDFFNTAKNQNNVNLMANPAGAQLMGEVVDLEGNVKYPVIGTVKVSGLTIFEIQDKLQTMADEFLESPKVNVRLLNFRVTVLGEVNRENQVIITNPRANILEAVAMAGGMGELADKSRVKLLRQEGDRVTVQYLNLLDEDLISSPYYYIHQNDIIVVPPLNQRPFRRYFGNNVALIASTLSLVLVTLNFISNTNDN